MYVILDPEVTLHGAAFEVFGLIDSPGSDLVRLRRAPVDGTTLVAQRAHNVCNGGFLCPGGLLLNRIVHPIDPRAGQTQWLVWISHHADVEQTGNLVSRNRFAGWWLLGYAIVLVIAALWLPGLPGMTLDGYGIWMATIALAGITLVFVTGWIYAGDWRTVLQKKIQQVHLNCGGSPGI